MNFDRRHLVWRRLEDVAVVMNLHEFAPVGRRAGETGRDLISGLPKMRRAGRTDVGDLEVSFSELPLVLEPLYAEA